MKIKMFRKVLRQAEYDLGRLSAFGTENGRVFRLRYPVGRNWVYDWMFGMRIDIYGNPRDKQFAIHKIARILWSRELKEYWTRKVGAKAEMSRYKFKGYTITNCGYHQPDHCVWWEAVNENGEACFHGNTLREVEFEILDYEWEQKMKKKDEEIEMLKHGKSDAFRNTPFGNAAAMREAINTMVNCIEWLCEDDNTGRIRKQFAPLLSDARAALSSPARNCDIFKTDKEAKYRFLQIAELPEGNGDADMREWYRKLIAWLFEPAEEGEGDGR